MKNPRTQKMVLISIVLLSLIGAWSAAGHYLPQPDPELVKAIDPPPGKEWFLEQIPRYEARPIMTALHVIPALLFMIWVPFQLSSRIRQKNISIHRWAGRLFAIFSISIGITGIAIGIIMPFGGLDEVVASILIGTGFLYSLIMGVVRVRQHRIAEHRQWMSRMLAFGFTPVTMRGIMISSVLLFDVRAPDIFGWTLLVGMVINLIVVEAWIRRKQPWPEVIGTTNAVTAIAG